MGAAASIKLLYNEALSWFRNYIDSETYAADFAAINKKHDGELSLKDLQSWISDKAAADPVWKIFSDHPQIIALSHKYASVYNSTNNDPTGKKVVDFGEFKALLIHLFATSILWTHFAVAEAWEHENAGHQQLTFDSFRIACRTLCETHAHEHLTDDQISEDFELLDNNKSGTISFMEVCNYCCRFIRGDAEDDASKIKVAAPKKFFGEVTVTEEDMKVHTGPKAYFQGNTVDEKSANALAALQIKLAEESAKAVSMASEAVVSITEAEAVVTATVFSPRLSPRSAGDVGAVVEVTAAEGSTAAASAITVAVVVDGSSAEDPVVKQES